MPAPPSALPSFPPMPQWKSRASSKSLEGTKGLHAPDWLTARPVAHRGLHDHTRGISENMPGAANAAIDGHVAIECDIQLTAVGEAMVHHGDDLVRLTEGRGALLQLTDRQVPPGAFQGTAARV